MTRVLPILLAAILCATNSQAAQLVVAGLDDDVLVENIELVAGEAPEDKRLLALYIEILPDQVRAALSAYGYFEPEVNVSKSITDDGVIVRVDVDAGLPVLIKSVSVNVTGPGENDIAFQNVRARIPLKENEIFISGDYEATKSLLIDAAQANGYFDFKFVTNRVLVSRLNRTAIINLIASSGPRFTFGTIRYDQNIFADNFLSRWAPFKEDDPYDASQLAELNENLQNSGYFSSIRVSPQRDVRYGPTVPVLVALERKDANQLGLGLGFSTDESFRGKATWGKPLINRAGHSADAEISASQPRQSVSFSYRIPRSNQPLYNYWGLEYGLLNEDDDGSQYFLRRLNFERVRRFHNDVNESIFLRWERERNVDLGDSDEFDTDLLLPGVAYSRKRSKGFPFLTWGQSTSIEFQYGNRRLFSTIDFFKATLNFRYIRQFAPRNTLLFSLQYGAITTNDFEKVPGSQRFFAGGDRSIRGFDYRSVSPLDADGDPEGGRYLEAATIEYAYRFTEKWSFAMFTDIGRAFNNFSTSQRVGGGIGIRWQSPVGPFRLDIARPIGEGSFSDIKIHLSLGPEL